MQLRVIWGALLMAVVGFAAVAWFVGPQVRSDALPPAMLWAMLGMAASSVLASQLVARSPMMKGPKQTRAIVSFALSESAGVVSGVALMLSGDPLCLAGIGVALASLASLYPRDEAEGETVKLIR